MSSSKLTWQAYDRVHQHHEPDWYWAVGIIAFAIMITAIMLHNTLFAILVAISTVVLFLRTLQAPRLITYEITNRGLWINKSFQSFTTLESFWVTELAPTKLIIKAKSLTTPLLVIPTEDIDSETMREFLQDYLPEEEHEEPFSKRVMEYLGF